MFVLPDALLCDPEVSIGGGLGVLEGGQLIFFPGGLDRHGGYLRNGLRGVAVRTMKRDPGSAFVSNQRLLTTEAPKMHVRHVIGLNQELARLTTPKGTAAGRLPLKPPSRQG